MLIIHLEFGQSHPGALTKAHSSRLLQDVTAKPVICPAQSMTKYEFILLSRQRQLHVSSLPKRIIMPVLNPYLNL